MTPEQLREESYAIKARWNKTTGMSVQDLIEYTIKSDAAKEYWMKDEAGKYEAALKAERERAGKLMEAAEGVIQSWSARMSGEVEKKIKSNITGAEYWSPIASQVDSEKISAMRTAINEYNNKP